MVTKGVAVLRVTPEITDDSKGLDVFLIPAIREANFEILNNLNANRSSSWW